jgi:hypothetical protein
MIRRDRHASTGADNVGRTQPGGIRGGVVALIL